MGSGPVYLDYNATSPMRPAVATALADLLLQAGNPSSVHRFGRLARREVEAARERVAQLVGATPAQVLFTASGTEANATALRGFPDRRLLVSAIEHPSVLAQPGATPIPVTADGRVDLDALARLLAADTRPALVSVMLANNETGIIQPVQAVVALARAHGALVHSDAVQAPGRIAVDFEALGVDMLTISAHKLGGPLGAAALVLAEGVEPRPLMVGGGQERGRRAGTENVPAIAGFGLAAELAADDAAAATSLADLRDRLEATVLGAVPGAAVIGAGVERLPNTSCLAMPGVSSDTQVMALDLAGVAISAGAACSSGKVKASPVLAAMGVPAALAGSAVRVSLGWGSVPRDIDRFLDAWLGLYVRRPSTTAQPAA